MNNLILLNEEETFIKTKFENVTCSMYETIKSLFNQDYADYKFVYKICNDAISNKYFVILEKPDDAITNEERKVFDMNYSKYRANKLLVKQIIRMNPNFINHNVSRVLHVNNVKGEVKRTLYKVDEYVSVHDYCTNIDETDTTGIHYYKTNHACFFTNQYPFESDYMGIWLVCDSDAGNKSTIKFKNGVIDLIHQPNYNKKKNSLFIRHVSDIKYIEFILEKESLNIVNVKHNEFI